MFQKHGETQRKHFVCGRGTIDGETSQEGFRRKLLEERTNNATSAAHTTAQAQKVIQREAYGILRRPCSWGQQGKRERCQAYNSAYSTKMSRCHAVLGITCAAHAPRTPFRLKPRLKRLMLTMEMPISNF